MRSNQFEIRAALYWRVCRFTKHLRQAFFAKRHVITPVPLFIVGCQRSGTNMLLDVLDKSLEVCVYNESDSEAFNNCRIKPFAERQKLIKKTNCQLAVFKALTDTQNVDCFLAEHPESKSIWAYRRYQDVANSAVKKWQSGQLSLIRLAATKPDWSYWLVERMTAQQRTLVQELYHPDMTWYSAGALKWYLRNTIFFDYHLDELPDRVMLARYESTVSSPSQEFGHIFRFSGITFNPAYVSNIDSSSIGKEAFPPIDPKIHDMCEELQNRLDQAFRLQANR